MADIVWRAGQQEVWDDPHRFIVVMAHRRWGKSLLMTHLACRDAIKPSPHQYPYRGYIVAPLQSQGMDNFWTYLAEFAEEHDGKAWFGQKKVTFPDTGAEVAIIGSEYSNDRHRGKYANVLCFDEVSQIAPSFWTKVARPMLADYKGRAYFGGTAHGKDWLHGLYQLGQNPEAPNWSSYRLPADKTGVIPKEELDEIRLEIGERDYRVEFLVDFDVAPLGALFDAESAAIKKEGRIRPLQHDPDLPVFCGWHFANQAICVAAIQPKRDQFHVLRFERWATTHISEVVRSVMAWPFVYGRHYGGGKLSGYTDSRIGVMNQLGVALQISDTAKILEDNLHDVRSMLPRCVFNVREDGQDDAADLLEAIRTAAVKYYDDTDTYGAQPGASWQVEAVMSLVHFARSHGEHSSDWSKPIDYAA